MKATINYLTLAALMLSALFYFSSCEVISNLDIDDDPNQWVDDSLWHIKAINSALLFSNAQAISGGIPASSNLSDLKLDKDKINFWPGLKTRIKILKGNNVHFGSVLVQVSGAEEYYKVKIEEEESNDTVSVFYMDIDPEKLALPIKNGKIKIAPVSETGDVIVDFEHPIEIDTPFDDDSYDPGKHNKSPNQPALNVNLHWIYTTMDGEFVNAPGHPWISNYTTMGCCNGGFSEPCRSFQAPNATITVDQQYSITRYEVIKFLENPNNWIYELQKSFNDYDPKTSDFCSLTAGYKQRNPGIAGGGSYTITPANGFETFHKITIQTSSVTLDDVLNTGFGPITVVNKSMPSFEYFLGSQYYVERINMEGSVILRVFEALGSD